MLPTTLETADAYVGAGLSVIPIKADGSKAPDWTVLPRDEEGNAVWKPYQTRLPTLEELGRWFGDGTRGIAIVCGAVSGNLEVMDFDDLPSFDAWEQLAVKEYKQIMGRLPIVATPDNGRHVYYRLLEAPKPSRKLAMTVGGETLVEAKGEGGYVLAPGSPARCHPSGRYYRLLNGPPLTHIPTLEITDVNTL